jgi:hypothetical protein
MAGRRFRRVRRPMGSPRAGMAESFMVSVFSNHGDTALLAGPCRGNFALAATHGLCELFHLAELVCGLATYLNKLRGS